MGAIEILKCIESLGVRVTAEGDKLILEPGSLVPVDLLDQVREHKVELLQAVCEAEAVHLQTVEEVTRQMEEHGSCLVFSDVLGEVIAFFRDDVVESQVPAGIVCYTRAELEETVGKGHDADLLRLVHEAKKHGAQVTGQGA